MIKIGITGSLASGKSTAAKYISNSKYPLFSADKEVQKIYKKNKFISEIRKKLKIKQKKKIKNIVRKIVKQDINKLKVLEKIIHPIIRKKMKSFIKLKKNKKLIFLEIPLLFESKLKKHFDVVIFVSSKKRNRLKRYTAKGGKKDFFYLLDKRQMRSKDKIKLSDHNLKNDTSLKLLKKNANILISKYE